MCKHVNVKFVQTIEAYHQRLFEGNEYWKNNEYGGTIRVNVCCIDCDMVKVITHKNKDKLPKWISIRIEVMKLKDDWFFD